ncbi:MAG TPA: hypothetical protein DCL75_14985, partial [Ktedonobacter sp.]|nr:hypothetical protein [Ktedonobacter sp.]
MDSKTNEMSNNKAHPYAKIVAGTLCLLLMLISLVIVSANSYAATVHQVTQNSNATPTITNT